MKFDTVDTIMRFIIVSLLLVVLITNIIEIANFANSRVKLSTLSSKDVNPSYDSLNLKYCDYYPMSEKNVINFENFKLLSIYAVISTVSPPKQGSSRITFNPSVAVYSVEVSLTPLT